MRIFNLFNIFRGKSYNAKCFYIVVSIWSNNTDSNFWFVLVKQSLTTQLKFYRYKFCFSTEDFRNNSNEWKFKRSKCRNLKYFVTYRNVCKVYIFQFLNNSLVIWYFTKNTYNYRPQMCIKLGNNLHCHNLTNCYIYLPGVSYFRSFITVKHTFEHSWKTRFSGLQGCWWSSSGGD